MDFEKKVAVADPQGPERRRDWSWLTKTPFPAATPEPAVGRRLFLVRRRLGLSASAMAFLMCVDELDYAAFEAGDVGLTGRAVALLAQHQPIDVLWLLTGESDVKAANQP